MANKLSKFLISAAAMIGSMGVLASCDDIEAKIVDEQYYGQILNEDNLTNNQLKIIYDALVTSGTTNSEKVLNNVLQAISNSKFGSYYEMLEATVDDATLTAFVAAHPIYGEGAEGKARVLANVERLSNAIAKKFWDIVKNTTYQFRSEFDEEKFYKAQKFDGYQLGAIAEGDFVKKIVSATDGWKSVGSYFNDDWSTVYKDYIVRTMLPAMERKLLVQEYIYTKNSGVIGRSYARKVNFVKVEDNSQYPSATRKLITAYAKNVIKEGKYDTVGFDLFNEVYKGTYVPTGFGPADTIVSSIYADAGYTADSVEVGGVTYNYYKETAYGKICEDFKKIAADRFTNDASVYSDFTNSGAYDVITGFNVKVNALQAQDATTDGWYTSSGLSSLPNDIKTRLFKVNVANEVDKADASGNKLANDDLTYGSYINGDYFLVKETSEGEESDPYPYIIKNESSYYIINVEEAVKPSKLSDGTGSYDNMSWHSQNPTFRENIARTVADLLVDNDTYTKNSNEHWIEEAALSFHDDAVYDYFCDTFPDLFED